MKLDIHIYGVHARDDMIAATASKLSISSDNIHYDDRPNGGLMMYTAKKAWLASIPENITHRIALADDVEVCDNFLEIAEQIAEAHPKSIISFFPYDFMKRVPQIEGCDTPYFKARVLSGCAIMMPVEYIQPCFKYVKERYNDVCADDEAIQSWAESEGIEILTTIPALVQHIGDESIANKGCFIRRTVYYDKNPVANWTSKKVMKFRLKEWFFSNHGKPRMGDDKGVLEVATEY